MFRTVALGGKVGTEALSPSAASLVIKKLIAAVGPDPAADSRHRLRYIAACSPITIATERCLP